MPKCSNCKYGTYELEGEWYIPIYYCTLSEEYIDEKDAENDDLKCDGYVEHDVHNNSTERA